MRRFQKRQFFNHKTVTTATQQQVTTNNTQSSNDHYFNRYFQNLSTSALCDDAATSNSLMRALALCNSVT